MGKWDWEGDGIYDNELQNLEIVTHRFTEAGTYNPTLWIEDVDGNNDHSSISIVVEQREELRQTIGEEGGVMQYKDLELLISPQTFDKGEDLSISIFESQSDFFICDPDASIFQVEGLPDNISAPIHIHFDVSTFPEKQDIELVIGQIGVLKTLDRLEICSVPIETVREGDILVGYIQPEDLGTQGLRSKTSSQTGTLWMSIISNRATFSSPLFKIKYDYKEISNSTLISNLHSYFVDAYNVIQNEFNLSWDGRTTWPIIIDVKPMAQEIDGEMVRPKMSWNVNKYYININSLIVNDESLCKSSSQHELFHLTQELYNNQHKKDHYWFDEAASTWSQDFGAPGSTNNSLDILSLSMA